MKYHGGFILKILREPALLLRIGHLSSTNLKSVTKKNDEFLLLLNFSKFVYRRNEMFAVMDVSVFFVST